MAPQKPQPDGKTLVGAVITVAAAYAYFLIFAQFGFLKAVQESLGSSAGTIRPIMAVMGVAGIAGSVMAAWRLTESRARALLAAGFGCCAVAAIGSLGASREMEFHGVALLVGLGTGLATVTLAGRLRHAVGEARLGLIIGCGTGLAYGLCNLPAVFEAAAAAQAKLAGLAALVGLAGGRGLVRTVTVEPRGGGDYSRTGVVAWVLVFLALVGLDSAAFYIIQQTPALKTGAWTGAGQLGVNAGLHLVTAVFAGWMLDRRGLGAVVPGGALLLLLACALTNPPAASPATMALLYLAGVSVYSTALVFYPARSGRPEVAAMVYAVAGWGGSALGIAFAEGRDRLPGTMVAMAAAWLAGALAWRYFASRRE